MMSQKGRKLTPLACQPTKKLTMVINNLIINIFAIKVQHQNQIGKLDYLLLHVYEAPILGEMVNLQKANQGPVL